MLFLKKFKDAKFAVDGNAFQTIDTVNRLKFKIGLCTKRNVNFVAEK